MSFLGIDIGTTNIKICLLNNDKKLLYEKSDSHSAFVKTELNRHEQDPPKVVTTLFALLEDAQPYLENVEGITITGQMHGIVLWNSKGMFEVKESSNDNVWDCSNLITWMDQRCDNKFLKKIPQWLSKCGQVETEMATGYGISSLYWLLHHNKLKESWDRSGTIMDFVAFILGSESNVISDHLAYSWGYVQENLCWQQNLDSRILKLLPEIKPADFLLTSKAKTKFFSDKVKIYIPIGDLQCTMYGYVEEGVAALHLGTSAQIAYCSEDKDLSKEYNHLLKVPYFNGQHLIVAASLNGGNAIDNFVLKIEEFHDQLFPSTIRSTKEDLLHKNALSKLLSSESTNTRVTVDPLFLSERHDPKGASFNNFTVDTSLMDMLTAIRIGVVENLGKMMPLSLLRQQNITTLRLMNRAATDKVCVSSAQKIFNSLKMEAINESNVSAAFGAAEYSVDLFSKLQID